MSKKILSIILALVLVLSMGTVALFSASAALTDLPEQAAGTYRYYFYLPEQWLNDSTASTGNTAGIYWWEGTGLHGSWPGVAANKADVDGIYYYDVPTDVTAIVWNNFFDGGADSSAPYYADAIQTRNIGTEYYDPGESDRYPNGTDNFDGMIYVVDFNICDYSDYSGKMTFGGDWFYYYGNGEYGTSKVKGDSDVYTDPLIDMDATMPRDTTAPSDPEDPTTAEPTTVEPTEAPTEAAGCDTNITVDGETKSACIGETITYTIKLKADELFEDVQAEITYDADKLELLTTKGTEACPGLANGLTFNAKEAGVVKFNAVYLEGYDFTAENVFVNLEFKVKAEGDAAINTLIEEMTMLTGDSYFTDGEPAVTEGITLTETLAVPEHPTVPVVEPTTAPKTEPSTPGSTSTDPTGTSGVTNGTTSTPNTGASAYIYVALAIVAMAAVAVVVLRKKANG